jgi:prepilin-type N-terminal cleavage/methylation domain-containing protein
MQRAKRQRSQKGFTLMETMIALVVLAVGILGLAAMLGDALTYTASSQNDFIAQQKAEQAVEAIFTAKYSGNAASTQINCTGATTWSCIANPSVTNPAGLFLTTAQPLTQPGPDGLVGSVNDTNAPLDYILQPGPDGVMGTADDVKLMLANFTRTITIADVVNEPNLRSINVVVNYTAGRFARRYTLTTYISAY